MNRSSSASTAANHGGDDRETALHRSVRRVQLDLGTKQRLVGVGLVDRHRRTGGPDDVGRDARDELRRDVLIGGVTELVAGAPQRLRHRPTSALRLVDVVHLEVEELRLIDDQGPGGVGQRLRGGDVGVLRVVADRGVADAGDLHGVADTADLALVVAVDRGAVDEGLLSARSRFAAQTVPMKLDRAIASLLLVGVVGAPTGQPG